MSGLLGSSCGLDSLDLGLLAAGAAAFFLLYTAATMAGGGGTGRRRREGLDHDLDHDSAVQQFAFQGRTDDQLFSSLVLLTFALLRCWPINIFHSTSNETGSKQLTKLIQTIMRRSDMAAFATSGYGTGHGGGGGGGSGSGGCGCASSLDLGLLLAGAAAFFALYTAITMMTTPTGRRRRRGTVSSLSDITLAGGFVMCHFLF